MGFLCLLRSFSSNISFTVPPHQQFCSSKCGIVSNYVPRRNGFLSSKQVFSWLLDIRKVQYTSHQFIYFLYKTIVGNTKGINFILYLSTLIQIVWTQFWSPFFSEKTRTTWKLSFLSISSCFLWMNDLYEPQLIFFMLIAWTEITHLLVFLAWHKFKNYCSLSQ